MKIQESRENYLEAILILEKQKGNVRSIDVANYLDFSKPSVSVAVTNLKNALLLTVTPEGWLKLTDVGRALAEQVYERHLLLTKLLITMGVDENTAQEDACRVEHVISQASFEKIKEYARRIGVEP